MVNLAVKCMYVYVYNLKSGGENGEVHYYFLWKDFLGNIPKLLFCTKMRSCTFYKILYDNFGGTQEYQMLCCFLCFW